MKNTAVLIDRAAAAWEIGTAEIGVAPPGSSEPGGFAFQVEIYSALRLEAGVLFCKKQIPRFARNDN